MAKSALIESRYDFRKGRNTSISPDLLTPEELIDSTNVRLSSLYGAVTKRGGTQRIHQSAFPGAILGVFQWDTTSGKQTVVISNGKLFWRNSFNFAVDFIEAATTNTTRTTAGQGISAGWTDPDGTNNGLNTLNRTSNGTTTVAEGSRLILKLGDPTVNGNLPSIDNLYKLKFKVRAKVQGFHVTTATVTLEYSLNNGGAWTTLPDSYVVQAGPSEDLTTEFNPTIQIITSAAPIWFRFVLKIDTTSYLNGNSTAEIQCFNTAYLTDNYAATWNIGAAAFSTTEPAIFAPFRASTAGAPLVLYIASGGHYFSWNGVDTLTQLDGTNAAPAATAIISYHTRMFAMSASTVVPGLLPKTIFWSRIGDATVFTTGSIADGGSAVTDFLTGQQLTALEVIGSSLLMGTVDSVMRFSGQSSEDIVISQNTEGVSAEVGPVGPLALKRFENIAGMLAARGPYAVTETSAVPIGEQVLPDFDALDSANLSKSIVHYYRGRKELLFIVPRSVDSGLNKTIFVYAPRLQSWYGPWTYSFGVQCAANYLGSSGVENVILGCNDGFVRLLDIGNLDDVLYDGTGGSNITMTGEFPMAQFGNPGDTKALSGLELQATLPTGSALQIKTSFDGASFTTDNVASVATTERNYRIDLNGQGKKLRLQFVDASAVAPIINGFSLKAYIYGRP